VTEAIRMAEHLRVVGLFRIVRRMADGLYVVETGGHSALWTRRKLRKNTHCSATRTDLRKGEMHYGPIGNMDYRGWRIHKNFMEGE
jgi:hypothetical protein